MARSLLKAFQAVSLLAIIVCASALCASAWAQESMQVMQNAPGFKPAMTYENFGKGESVNNLNGGLTVSHASSISLPQNLGASLTPMRVYNAKNLADSFGFDSRDKGPIHGWLGMNWTLSFGRIQLRIVSMQSTAGTYYARAQYFYTDESGAEHRLYLSCQSVTTPNCGLESYTGANQVPTSGTWYVTNDSSYIRAKYGESGNAGKWRVYLPDGSTRILGGTLNQDYLPTDPKPVSGTSYWDINHYQQGWYTTQIKDRVGNTINITHYPYQQDSSDPVNNPYAGSQPYMGAIQAISDQFGRSISFQIYSGESPVSMLNGLLKSITVTATSATEYYTYNSFGYLNAQGVNITCPEPISVTDVGGLQTLYSYDQYYSGGELFGTVLDRIDYPTGATSAYHYTHWTYLYQSCPQGVSSCEPQVGDMIGVDSHTEYVTNAGGSDNTATWSWDRDFNNGAGCISNSSINPSPVVLIPVVTTDPLGQQTVHYFSCEVAANDQFPPGLEMATFVYHMGTRFNRSSPTTNAVSRKSFMYKFRGGDADRCVNEYFVGGTPPAQYVPLGNSRVGKTVEFAYSPTGTQLWWKSTKNDIWDGYGHYLLTETASNQFTGTWVEGRAYQIMVGTTGYQLDRQTLSYTGTATSITGTSIPDNTIAFPADNSNDITLSGGFRLVRNTYTETPYAGAAPYAGLLSTRSQFRSLQPTFTVLWGGGTPSITDVTPGSYDPTATLAYNASDVGNISSVAYTRGQAGNNYTANFYWQYAMVNRMQWTNVAYNELTRGIDQATSRITSQTDANGLETDFTYDALGRLTEIIPPGGEYHTVISYPTTSKYRSVASLAHSWVIGNQILFFKGNGSIPSLTPGTLATGLDAQALYTQYQFDDKGRLWKSDTVMPDSTWTETLTQYDPFGAAVFTSDPYSLNGTYRSTITKTYPLASGSGSWTVTVPSNFANAYCGYGAWSSMFSGATCSNPFPSANSIDDFHRVLWTLKGDQSTIQNQYDVSNDVGGIKTSVTMIGCGGTSTTTYTRDILGRLTNVAPPAGTAAAYTYDSIGNLTQANLHSQLRSFTYDALGHVTLATNPESGQVTYSQYDALGNLLKYTDGNATIQKTLDAKGRPTAVSNFTTGRTLATWTYDESGHGPYSYGQVTSTTATREDGLGSVQESYAYDQMGGRLGSKTVTINTTSVGNKSYTLSYVYDTMGQVTNEGYARGTDLIYKLTSSYGRGQLATKKFSDNNGVTGTTYSPSGALASVLMTNGVTDSFVEDQAMPRTGSISVNGGSGLLWSTGNYTYDGMGNITAMGSQNSNPVYSYGTFCYDLLGRLTSATVSHVAPTASNYFPSFGYTYDNWGNLTARNITNDVAGNDALVPLGTTEAQALERQCDFSLTMATSGGVPTNRITSVTRGQTSAGTGLITPVTTNVSYDGNGNVTNDGSSTLTYDALNQTLQVTTNNGAVMTEKYVYDASGERSAVVRYNSQGVIDSAAYYARTGAQVIGEDQFQYAGGTLSGNNAKAYLYVGGNMAVSEIGGVGPSYSISGTITLSGSGLSGVTVSTNTGLSATTNASGAYSILGLASGTYTVTPTKSGYTFSPASQNATISGANVTGINFTATSTTATYSVSGTITSGGFGVSGATVSTTGASTTTSSSGAYTLTGLANGTYTISASRVGYSISPLPPFNGSVTISGANLTGKNFTATPTARYNISGQITVSGVGLPSVYVATNTGVTATTDTNGNYTLTGLGNGTYTVTPLKSGYACTPSYQSVTVSGANVTGKNFTAVAASTYSISGRVTLNGSGLNNAIVWVGGSSAVPATTDSNGNWSVSGLINAMYLVGATKGTYSFYPAALPVTVSFANVTNVNFQAGWSIPVQVTLGGIGLAGVSVATVGPPAQTVVTDSSGANQLTGLYNGTYTITPSKAGYSFSPVSYSVTISGGSSNLKTFTATFTGMAGLGGESAPAGELGGGSSSGAGTVQEEGGSPDYGALTREEAMAAHPDDGVSSGQGGQGEDPDGSVRIEALTNVTATYYAWDHLGTTRVVMAQNGTVVDRHDFEPFGVELRSNPNGSGTTHWWTGHERDGNSATPGQTGYDYMHFRYYGSNLGRFMKPDDNSAQRPETPQSWNLYSYVKGNPVNFNDPTGHVGKSDEDQAMKADANEASTKSTMNSDEAAAVGEALCYIGAVAGAAHLDLPMVYMFLAMGESLHQRDAVGFAMAPMGGKSGEVSPESPAGVGEAPRPASEGIYQVKAASGKDYVGQSNSIPRRLGEHVASGKITKEAAQSAQTTSVPGGKTAREVAEQQRINQLGGVKNLENKVNPIGPARQHLLEQDPPK